ncbi:hypothetical protein D3C77_581980 [compost metagenome]
MPAIPIIEACFRPARLLQPGVIGLPMINFRHQDWAARCLPLAVGYDRQPFSIFQLNMHLQQQSQLVTINGMQSFPGEMAFVPPCS